MTSGSSSAGTCEIGFCVLRTGVCVSCHGQMQWSLDNFLRGEPEMLSLKWHHLMKIQVEALS